MKPLSALDALFLHLETPATPVQVGAAHLHGRPRGGGDFVQRVRRDAVCATARGWWRWRRWPRRVPD